MKPIYDAYIAPHVALIKLVFWALLAGAFFILWLSLSIAKKDIKVLEGKLTVSEATLKEERQKLEDLAVKREKLEADIKSAQVRAEKIRKNSQKEVQRILSEQWPKDCQAAADKAWEEVQKMKGPQ